MISKYSTIIFFFYSSIRNTPTILTIIDTYFMKIVLFWKNMRIYPNV